MVPRRLGLPAEAVIPAVIRLVSNSGISTMASPWPHCLREAIKTCSGAILISRIRSSALIVDSTSIVSPVYRVSKAVGQAGLMSSEAWNTDGEFVSLDNFSSSMGGFGCSSLGLGLSAIPNWLGILGGSNSVG